MPIDPSTQYLYLTTTGRSSGEPREIEIWFGLIGSTVYLLSGSGVDNGRPRAHWVRNILQKPEVTVRIDDVTYRGIARIVVPGTVEDTDARALLVAKYRGGSNGDLTKWGQTALVVAVGVESV